LSTKNIAGPATTLWLPRVTALFASGWSSAVMKAATGPVMPAGMTHCSIGSESENAMPPASNWHDAPLGALLNAAEVNEREEPGRIASVLVIVNAWLAVISVIAQPEFSRNGPAIARTSCGVRGRSNGFASAAPPLNTFSIVEWRLSTVRMDAAAVRMVGSEIKFAAPRNAPTPTFSTRRESENVV